MNPTFATYFKDRRIQQRMTLRDFCIKAEADPANISRIERALVPPPQDHAILARYAAALGIKDGTDDWFTFCDLAAAGRGIIPKDIMDDKELAAHLPAIFRTIRGAKPATDDMLRLVEKIRLS